MAVVIFRVVVSAVLSAILSQALGVAHTDVDMTTKHMHSDGGHRFVYAVLDGHDNVTECQVYGDSNVLKLFNIESVVVPSDVMTEMIEYFHRTSVGKKHRYKRAFIHPGTKWCGNGNIAKNDKDLGWHKKTDACCRTHDKCDDSIVSMSVKYGLINWSPYTRSKCECDRTFYKCLVAVKSMNSNFVGWWYFDFLNMKCFEKRKVRKCTGWWGNKKCKNKSSMQFVDAGVWKRQ